MRDLGWNLRRLWRRKSVWVPLAVAGSVGLLALYRVRSARDGKAGRAPRPGPEGDTIVWRIDSECRTLPAGKRMRIETGSPAIVHWSTDQWQTVTDSPTIEETPDTHAASLETRALRAGSTIVFTLYWPESDRWEGEDFSVKVQ